MRKVAVFLFDTWYGALAACAVSATGMVVGVLFGFLREGEIAARVFGVLLFLSGLALVAAFVRSLRKRAWGRAAAQLVLGLAGLVGFVLAWVVTVFSSVTVAHMMGWVGSVLKNGVVPFEVEYRSAHPFLAEYDRRVAFASGKRVGIAMDTGGDAELPVYVLEDGTYAMTDDGERLFRVDTAAETVDMGVYRRWFRLPDETVDIGSWGPGGVNVELESGMYQPIRESVPFGRSMDGRRLLGKFVPYGKFIAEAEDRLGWLDGTSWRTCEGWPEELPFALEREVLSPEGDVDWRVVFASGKTVWVASALLDVSPFSVHGMADGNYALTPKGNGGLKSKVYRIRPGDERVDCRVKGAWVELPEGIQRVVGTGFSFPDDERSVRGLDENGNVVEGTNSVPVGATLDGMRLLGRVTRAGTFERAEQEDEFFPAAKGTKD